MSPVAYVALFGAGVTTVAAPCVLPLLPVYVTVVLDAASRGGRVAVARAGLSFVAGFSTVFVALGTAAGALGAVPGPRAWVPRTAAVLLVALGLLTALRPQSSWRWPSVRILPVAAGRGGRWRPMLVGAAFAGTWTPCVGPLLGAALVTAGAGTDPLVGAGLLAAFSAGLGVPFLALCLFVAATGGTGAGLSRRMGRHALAVQRLCGGLLVLLGFLVATGRPGWPGLTPGAG
jgi:cytochrome c-type biogenesis protein